MDISVYISELLYEHDCVIIPGFGGFICNYKPAVIHPVVHTISPPSKAVSFNKNLQSNDGLLVNYVAAANHISFDTANDIVATWANSAQSLLKNDEELNLQKIGKFYRDIEGNLQFTPDESVNYLKASFGLKTIVAEPVLRGKEISLTEKYDEQVKPRPLKLKRIWKLAATILLVAGIASVTQLMRMGVEIKSLKLDEANVFSFISHIFSSGEREMQPIPVEVEEKPVVVIHTVPDNSHTADTASVSIQQTTSIQESNNAPVAITASADQRGYYIITGSFKESKNIEAAKNRLSQKFPGSSILIQKRGCLTKVGYFVGTTYYKAKEQLIAAREEDPSFWLLKK